MRAGGETEGEKVEERERERKEIGKGCAGGNDREGSCVRK